MKPLKIATEQTKAIAKWLNFNAPKTRHKTYADDAEFWPVIFINFFDEDDQMLFMMKYAGTIPEIAPRHWQEPCGTSLSALQWQFSRAVANALNSALHHGSLKGCTVTRHKMKPKNEAHNGKWTNPKASIKSARQARAK